MNKSEKLSRIQTKDYFPRKILKFYPAVRLAFQQISLNSRQTLKLLYLLPARTKVRK
jgi:hypothetical protein